MRRIFLPQAPRREALEFTLTGPYVALNDLLKLAGVCASGGAGKALVASGSVQVDGAVELRKTCKIRSGQTVLVGSLAIHVQAGPAAVQSAPAGGPSRP